MTATIRANGRRHQTENFDKNMRKPTDNIIITYNPLTRKRKSTDDTDETDSRTLHLRWYCDKKQYNP
jgi:hypothetical protein